MPWIPWREEGNSYVPGTSCFAEPAVSARRIDYFSLDLAAVSTGMGASPGPIDLQYDPQTKVLHAELRHVTDNQRQHHIRRLYVYKNDAPTQKFSYVKQTTATRLIQDVPLDASSGDTIRVKAVCSEAGYKEETLVIP